MGTRVQLDMPDASFQRLRRIKEVAEAASYAEVIRDALRVFEYLLEQDVAGSRFFLEDKSGQKSEIKLFI
jgi:hypothetical protein